MLCSSVTSFDCWIDYERFILIMMFEMGFWGFGDIATKFIQLTVKMLMRINHAIIRLNSKSATTKLLLAATDTKKKEGNGNTLRK